jgi:Protein of unknown function (DUF4238)
MASQKVKDHTDATPQVYLRRFAVDGAVMSQRTGGSPTLLGTPVVGVRRRFYTVETRQGGSNQVEDALMRLEDRVCRVFAKVDAAQLPLSTPDKAVMAEFIGTQMCRGMKYRSLHRGLFEEREPVLRDVGAVIDTHKLAAMSMNHHTRTHPVDWLYWQPHSEPAEGHPFHDEALSGPPPSRSLRWQLVHEHVEKLIEDRAQNSITVFTV